MKYLKLLQKLLHTLDIIPLPGLETEIVVTGIRGSPDRNNDKLIMYYVSEYVAYLSKITKTIIGARHYVSPHQISDGLLLSLGNRCTKSKPKHILSFVKVWSRNMLKIDIVVC